MTDMKLPNFFREGLNLGTVSLRRRSLLNQRCLVLTIAYIGCMLLFGTAFYKTKHTNVDQKQSGGGFFQQYFGSFDASDLSVLKLARRWSLRSEFAARRRTLDEVCQKYSQIDGPANQKVNLPVAQQRWYYMKRPDFMLCMIPKVASTSLGNFIISMHQFARSMTNLGFSGNYTSNVSSKTYRAMVVRHPLDRLLSAYKYIFHDELKKDTNRTKLYSNLTKMLLMSYRDENTLDLDNDVVTFPEFVRYLLNGTVDNLKGEWDYIPGRSNKFWVTDDNINAHWIPYVDTCTPCNPLSRPDAIVKLDSGDFKREIEHVFDESGVLDFFRSRKVNEKKLSSLPWRNKNSESRNKDKWKKYFGQLSKSDVKGLYQKFRLDHEMFGYEIEPFLSYAKSDSP